MLDFLNQISSTDFMPHGNCFLWQPGILYLHVISDSIVALAYYSIPFAMLTVIGRRSDIQFGWLFKLFAAFIFLCGTTHVLAIWTVWHPDFLIDGLVKAATALVSVITAVALWPLVPVLVKIPSPNQLMSINRQLEKSLAENTFFQAIQEISSSASDEQRLLQDIGPSLFFAPNGEQFALGGIYLSNHQDVNDSKSDQVGLLTLKFAAPRSGIKESIDPRLVLNSEDRTLMPISGSAILEQDEYFDQGEWRVLSFGMESEHIGLVVFRLLDGSHPFGARDAVFSKPTAIIIGNAIKRVRAETQVREYYDSLEEQIQHRTAELEHATNCAIKANEAKSTFLANMSHELRTPMHSILSFSDFGVKKWASAPREKLFDYFEKINRSGKRLMVLLDGLLDLAKIESGRMEFLMHEQDITDLMNSCIEEQDIRIEDSGLQLQCKFDAKQRTALVDRLRIGQVFNNILCNAIKFSPRGSSIYVDISDDELVFDDRGGQAETISAFHITITDQGPGIPDNQLETIFEEFYQSSRTSTGAGGTGLGLAISLEIIEKHFGRIWAETIGQEGAVLHVVLPVRPPRDCQPMVGESELAVS